VTRENAVKIVYCLKSRTSTFHRCLAVLRMRLKLVDARCKTPTMHVDGSDRTVQKPNNRRWWLGYRPISSWIFYDLGRKVMEKRQVTTKVATRQPALPERKRLRCTKMWPRCVIWMVSCVYILHRNIAANVG